MRGRRSAEGARRADEGRREKDHPLQKPCSDVSMTAAVYWLLVNHRHFTVLNAAITLGADVTRTDGEDAVFDALTKLKFSRKND